MKEEIIHELRQAKRAHKQWVGYAQALSKGIPLSKDQLPINETECNFGQWWFTDGQKLKTLPHFSDIEQLHALVHDVYSDILIILFDHENVGFFKKLLGQKSRSLSEVSLMRLEQKTIQLMDASNALIEMLDKLESIITRTDDETLSKYYH